MKFFLYLGLVTIFFTIGECLQCYNCYHGPVLRNDQVDQLIREYSAHTPNERCVINNGVITGPTCDQSNGCVDMNADLNNEKTNYHFCSYVDSSAFGVGSFVQTSGDEYLKVTHKVCSTDLCNGASPIITITSLTITLVLLSLCFS